jgi:tRNA A-37 threonylcarbamoyl transferase component Bud32
VQRERYQQIKAILGQALELPVTDRARFLVAACGGDETLRAEVDGLLAHDDEDAFMQPILASIVPEQAAPAHAVIPVPDPRIGRTIRHYQILRRLGEGGMGVVYQAEDSQLRRRVALKFLRPDLLLDPVVMKRFLHEARAGAALDHPNICAVHGIEETDHGESFMVLAFCDGESLKQRLASGPMGGADALAIACAIADGLRAAHASGVIHRDIKPGNIMLTPSGVKILDFGIAKVFDQTSVTVRGAALGTAAYSSPEQAEGRAVDQRTDVFALGTIVHEMLTGFRPFDAASDGAALETSLDSECAGMAPAFESVLARAVAPDRDDRFASMDEFIAAIRPIQRALAAGTPTQRRPWQVLHALLHRVSLGGVVPADEIETCANATAVDPDLPLAVRISALRAVIFLKRFDLGAKLASGLIAADADAADVRFDLAVSLAKAGHRDAALEASEGALTSPDGRLIMLAALSHAAAGAGDNARAARTRRVFESSQRAAVGSRLLRSDATFGATTQPLEFFGPARALPGLPEYLALRRVPGSLASTVDQLGLLAYLGFDSELDCLVEGPSARVLQDQLDRGV